MIVSSAIAIVLLVYSVVRFYGKPQARAEIDRMEAEHLAAVAREARSEASEETEEARQAQEEAREAQERADASEAQAAAETSPGEAPRAS
ncbi:MAG: hypothetical protein DI571_03795 [Arsenicicoccus sp.]|nr:MAG: hypothetical protein DI571_03795 [Arsenicicoccus sp.]